jgi:hypothetical protein
MAFARSDRRLGVARLEDPAWQTMFRGLPDNARTFDHARRLG